MTPSSEPQSAGAVLMVRPYRFGWNGETAASNTYQLLPSAPAHEVHQQALREFEGLRTLLIQNGVSVLLFDDLPEPATPDSLFPNNWFSTHGDGTLVLYPMAALSRRAERRPQLIDALRRELFVRRVLDLSRAESEGRFLEGTGSLVLDRVHRVAYAARSLRTDAALLDAFAADRGYRPLLFDTLPQRGQPIYHTNVVMSVGTAVAVVCLDVIAEPAQRAAVSESLADSGHDVVPISIEQMNEFAGNLLELRGRDGGALWVMSTRAYSALRPQQRERIAASGRLVHAPLSVIESVGGGSARCMLSELFPWTPTR